MPGRGLHLAPTQALLHVPRFGCTLAVAQGDAGLCKRTRHHHSQSASKSKLCVVWDLSGTHALQRPGGSGATCEAKQPGQGRDVRQGSCGQRPA